MWILFLIVIIGLAFAVVFYHIKNPSAKTKGEIGEHVISKLIRRAIRQGLSGFVLSNVYLPKSDGGTSEIDVLFVSSKGIFVVESKNFAGYVFGDDQRKQWTVSLYAGKNWLGIKQTKKYFFYNPVWQNRSHIKNLWKLIGQDTPTYSLIVFSNRCDLINVRYDPSESLILRSDKLLSFFTLVKREYPDVLSPHDLQRLYGILAPFTQVREETKLAHIAAIHSPNPIPDRCPWCGGALVLRSATRGTHIGQQFYGCSNYPKCHYRCHVSLQRDNQPERRKKKFQNRPQV